MEVGGGEVEREVERDAWTVVKLASLSGLSVFWLGGDAGQASLDLAMLNVYVASKAY